MICVVLFSVLNAFVYDPLFEWTKSSKNSYSQMKTIEIKNEKVRNAISFCPNDKNNFIMTLTNTYLGFFQGSNSRAQDRNETQRKTFVRFVLGSVR